MGVNTTPQICKICETAKERDDLLEACKVGLDYVKGSSGCEDKTCLVCIRKANDFATIEQAIANAEK